MRGALGYRSVSVASASPEQLVLLLFETALKRQVQAAEALRAKQWMEASAHLRRVRDIFCELAASLDHEVAPELTNNLQRLYVWCITEIARADREGDPALLDATMAVTRNLYEGWCHALEKAA